MDYDFLNFDKKLFLFLNGKHNGFFDILMYWVGNMLVWIPLCVFISYMLIKNFDVESKTRLFLNSALILILAVFQFVICINIIPSFFEGAIQRLRPCYDPALSDLVRLLGDDCGDMFGFFAPRSCLAFSIAVFLSFALENKYYGVKILVFLWAILVSYSRVYAGFQFPANVIFSDLIGVLIGFLLYRSFFYVKNSVLAI